MQEVYRRLCLTTLALTLHIFGTHTAHILSAQLTSPRSFPCALALRVGFLRKLSSLGDVALAWSGLQNRSGLVGLPDFEFENTLGPQGPKAQL